MKNKQFYVGENRFNFPTPSLYVKHYPLQGNRYGRNDKGSIEIKPKNGRYDCLPNSKGAFLSGQR